MQIYMSDAGLIPVILEVESATGIFRLGVRCFRVVDVLVSMISCKDLVSPSSSVSGSEFEPEMEAASEVGGYCDDFVYSPGGQLEEGKRRSSAGSRSECGPEMARVEGWGLL